MVLVKSLLCALGIFFFIQGFLDVFHIARSIPSVGAIVGSLFSIFSFYGYFKTKQNDV